MGNRLTQIATRTGDAGTTGLGDNTRVSKNSLRVHAMGDVDELNSQIGVLLCEDMPADVRALLVEIQHQLFNLGGELSIPGYELLKPEAVAALDEALEHLQRAAAAPAGIHPARGQPCRRPRPTCAAPWRAAPNARWSRWATKKRSRTARASTSTACPT